MSLVHMSCGCVLGHHEYGCEDALDGPVVLPAPSRLSVWQVELLMEAEAMAREAESESAWWREVAA